MQKLEYLIGSGIEPGIIAVTDSPKSYPYSPVVGIRTRVDPDLIRFAPTPKKRLTPAKPPAK